MGKSSLRLWKCTGPGSREVNLPAICKRWFVLVLIIWFAIAMLHFATPALAQPFTWTQVNTGGFGDPVGNRSTFSMAVYNDNLYAGTINRDVGCQVWEYNGTGWTQVNSNGFGDADNEIAFSMAVYNGSLYAGTLNDVTGCEVWRYNSGGWTQVNTGGFGNLNNRDAAYMAVYNDNLYVGTLNRATGCEVWRYNSSTWTQVNTNGFGDADNWGCRSLAVYNNRLYAGTMNDTTGCQVWSYNGSTWTPVMANGFGNADNWGCRSLMAYDGRLFAGTAGFLIGCQVWEYNGTSWRRSDPGTMEWDAARTMVVGGNNLYLGTGNWLGGGQVWQYDGSTWVQVNTDGFGDWRNEAVHSLAVYGPSLYAGTIDKFNTGAKVWRASPPLGWTLTVNKAGTGRGSVFSDPEGINCDGDCTHTYPIGTVVTLTASPHSFSTFAGWSGGGCSGLGDCTVTLDSPKTVTATFNGSSVDSDRDGVTDFREQGPGGDNPSYDGNQDGRSDYLQDHVASFPTHVEGGTRYLTLESLSGRPFVYGIGLRTIDPAPPLWVSFPYGYFSFKIRNLDEGGSTTVTVYLDGLPPQTYYKYGPTPDNPRDHWYEFDYDGTTGVEKVGDTMVLHLVDGGRGDHDLMANGEIVDPGGPAAISSREVLNFPYIATTSETELGVINGESYDVMGNITYYGGDGEQVGFSLLFLNAKGKMSLGGGQIPDGAASAVIYADGGLAGYTRYVSSEGKRCSWPGSRRTATSIGVPYCTTGTEWRTGLALFNPNPEEVLVSIGLDSGEKLELDLGAREQELLWLEGTECATRITASGRISAVEMFDSLVDGGDLAAVLLEGTSSSSLYVPTISFGEGSFTQVGILNGSWDSITSVTGTQAGGAAEDVDLGLIEAQSQVAVDLTGSFSPDTLYAEIWGEVVEVTPMGTPVAMYQGLVSYGEGGTEKLGAVKLNGLGFTEGFLGVASSELAPTFGLVNPGGVDAMVAVTARDRAGTVVNSSSMEISAGSNLTGLVSDLLGEETLEEVTHIQFQSNVEIYGLETSYPDTRMEILPILTVE